MDRASAWRARGEALSAESVVDLALPSGVTIRARRPGPAQLAIWNAMPLSLAAAAASDSSDDSKDIIQRMSMAEMAEQISIARDMLLWCVVEPRISVTPAAGEIHPRDIPGDDLAFILAWARRLAEVRPLESFRAERADGVAHGDGDGVSRAAEPAAGD